MNVTHIVRHHRASQQHTVTVEGLLVLPSACVSIRPLKQSVNTLEAFLRAYCPPIIGRIEADRFIVDLRTVQADELPIIREAMETFLQRGDHDGKG